MQTRMRMIAAGAAVVLLTGTAGAAAATTAGTASPAASTSSPVPKPSPTGSDDRGKDQAAWLAKLAASLHVSVQKLNAALIDAKQTIGRLQVQPTDPAVVAVVEHDLGISVSQATKLIEEVFGDGPGKGGNPGKTPPPPGTPDPRLSQALAAILHISDARAAQVIEQLQRIAYPNRGVSADDPRFEALAASLHLTPQQLENALIQMKETVGASQPSPSKTPAPGR